MLILKKSEEKGGRGLGGRGPSPDHKGVKEAFLLARKGMLFGLKSAPFRVVWRPFSNAYRYRSIHLF